MPNDPAVDGSVSAVADRIAARRAAGNIPKPDGPPPDGLVDEDDYKPSQNLHTDDESPSLEQLRNAALGEDEPRQDDGEAEQVTDDEQELAAATDEDEPTDAEADDQGVELAFDSIDELAELVGMDVDDVLTKVKIGTVVDGEAGEITLADMRKGHQLESSFTRKNQAFVERVKAFEQEQEAQRAQTADHFAKATNVLNMAQQEFVAEFNAVDWNTLQTTDPHQWAVKRQQFGERQAKLNRMLEATTQQIDEAAQNQEKAANEARERHLEEQHDLLMTAVPEWQKNENRRAKEGTQIAEYLAVMGYTPEEIANCEDHRLVLLARAALGLAGPSKQKLDLAKKKIDKVANLVKPGNSDKRRAQGKSAFTKQAQDAHAALKKSGSTDDAAKAILARKLARQASAKRGRRARV